MEHERQIRAASTKCQCPTRQPLNKDLWLIKNTLHYNIILLWYIYFPLIFPHCPAKHFKAALFFFLLFFPWEGCPSPLTTTFLFKVQNTVHPNKAKITVIVWIPFLLLTLGNFMILAYYHMHTILGPQVPKPGVASKITTRLWDVTRNG